MEIIEATNTNLRAIQWQRFLQTPHECDFIADVAGYGHKDRL
jgi:hypothetical protein